MSKVTSNPIDELIDRVCRGVASLQEGQQLRAYIEGMQKQAADESAVHTKTIEERDSVEAYADQLAEMIGMFCEVDIGEHSSANDPWENAIEAMRVAIGNKQLPGEPGCSLCAFGMNSFIDPDTGNRIHVRNGVARLCSAQPEERK